MVRVTLSPTYTVPLTRNLILVFNYSKTQYFIMLYHREYVQILAQKMLKLQDIYWNVHSGILKGKFSLLINLYTTRGQKGCGVKLVTTWCGITRISSMHLFAFHYVCLKKLIKRLRNSFKTGTFILCQVQITNPRGSSDTLA